MIESIRIENLRGVREGEVTGLSPLSILVGPNNCGKSTVLEALAVAGYAGSSVTDLILRRGGPTEDALEHCHFDRDMRRKILVSVVTSDASQVRAKLEIDPPGDHNAGPDEQLLAQGLQRPWRVVGCTWTSEREGKTLRDWSVNAVDANGKQSTAFVSGEYPDSPVSARFLDVEAVRGAKSLEHAVATLEDHKKLGPLVTSLRPSLSDLKDFRILRFHTDFVAFAVFDERRPIATFAAGDGLKRFVVLAAATCGIAGGTLLLEEPESFQHPRYVRELVSWLVDTATTGTQVILTTHSIELIDEFLGTDLSNERTWPTVHRLSLIDGTLDATRYDRRQAIIARESLLQDLRR